MALVVFVLTGPWRASRAARARRGVGDRAAPGTARRPRLRPRPAVHLRPARVPARAAARVPVVGAAGVRVGGDRAGRARRHAPVGAAARVPLVRPRGGCSRSRWRVVLFREPTLVIAFAGARRARGRARARPRRAGALALALGVLCGIEVLAKFNTGAAIIALVRDRARRGAVAAAPARRAVRARGRRHRGVGWFATGPVGERDRRLPRRRAGDRLGLLGGDGARGPGGGWENWVAPLLAARRPRGGVARGRGAAAARAARARRAVGGARVHDLQGGLRAPRPRPPNDLLRVAAGRARRVRVGAAPAPDRVAARRPVRARGDRLEPRVAARAVRARSRATQTSSTRRAC